MDPVRVIATMSLGVLGIVLGVTIGILAKAGQPIPGELAAVVGVVAGYLAGVVSSKNGNGYAPTQQPAARVNSP